MNGKPVAILLTHGHFDHILAAQAVKEKYNIPIYACRQEEEMLREPSINMTVHYGQGCSIVPDVFLEDLDVIRLAGFSVQMIHTPGHTQMKVYCSAVIQCSMALLEERIFRVEVQQKS